MSESSVAAPRTDHLGSAHPEPRDRTDPGVLKLKVATITAAACIVGMLVTLSSAVVFVVRAADAAATTAERLKDQAQALQQVTELVYELRSDVHDLQRDRDNLQRRLDQMSGARR